MTPKWSKTHDYEGGIPWPHTETISWMEEQRQDGDGGQDCELPLQAQNFIKVLPLPPFEYIMVPDILSYLI